MSHDDMDEFLHCIRLQLKVNMNDNNNKDHNLLNVYEFITR